MTQVASLASRRPPRGGTNFNYFSQRGDIATKFRWMPLALLGLTIQGCADSQLVTAPTPQVKPSYNEAPPPEAGDLPAEFYTAPSVTAQMTVTTWDGGTAKGSAFMEFYGNRVQQTVNLVISKTTDGSEVRAFPVTTEDSWPGPWFRTFQTEGVVAFGPACGHTLDGSSSHSSWHEAPTPLGVVPWGKKTTSSRDETPAVQPACTTKPCGPATNTDDTAYDPYSSGTGDCSGGGGDSSTDGGGGGSPTCYEIIIHRWYSRDGGVTWQYGGSSSGGTLC